MLKDKLQHITGILAICAMTCFLIGLGMAYMIILDQLTGYVGKVIDTPYLDKYIEIVDSKLEPVTELTIVEDLEAEVSGMTIPEQIRAIAQEQDFIDEDLLVNIAYCESSFRPSIRGDNGHSRGLFQINDIAYPEIPDEQAFSVRWSVLWAIDRIKAGQQYKEWTNCMKKIDDWI